MTKPVAKMSFNEAMWAAEGYQQSAWKSVANGNWLGAAQSLSRSISYQRRAIWHAMRHA